jgi:hypothetical protein
VRKFWKYIGAITNVWRANPAVLTAASTRAFPVKCATLTRPPVSFSLSGSVDQIEVLDPGVAGGLHGRRTDLGLTRHLRGIPEVSHDEGSVRPLQRGTEGARVEQVALDHLDSTRCQRPRSVAGGIAADNAHRELARAHERVHDATTLQTRTTEYRYDLLGHHHLLVPDASRFGTPSQPGASL